MKWETPTAVHTHWSHLKGSYPLGWSRILIYIFIPNTGWDKKELYINTLLRNFTPNESLRIIIQNIVLGEAMIQKPPRKITQVYPKQDWWIQQTSEAMDRKKGCKDMYLLLWTSFLISNEFVLILKQWPRIIFFFSP